MPPKPKTPPVGEVEEEPPKPPEPVIETSKFTYDYGATYVGEFTMMYEDGTFFIPPPAVDPGAPPPVEDKKSKGKGKGKEPEPEVEVPKFPPRRVRHGKGVFTDGAVKYEGGFSNDAFHGEGKFKFVSGSTYEGQFVNGVFEGKGKFTWADGTFYEGDFENNMMEGDGVFTDVEKHAWAGRFTNNTGPGLINQL